MYKNIFNFFNTKSYVLIVISIKILNININTFKKYDLRSNLYNLSANLIKLHNYLSEYYLYDFFDLFMELLLMNAIRFLL